MILIPTKILNQKYIVKKSLESDSQPPKVLVRPANLAPSYDLLISSNAPCFCH